MWSVDNMVDYCLKYDKSVGFRTVDTSRSLKKLKSEINGNLQKNAQISIKMIKKYNKCLVNTDIDTTLAEIGEDDTLLRKQYMALKYGRTLQYYHEFADDKNTEEFVRNIKRIMDKTQ